MFTALTLAVTAMPMEVYAYTYTCNVTNPSQECNEYEQNLAHYHRVNVTSGTVTAGTFYMHVDIRNATISAGIFQGGVRLGGGTTVTGGDFSGTVVTISGSADITGGKFGNVTVNNDATHLSMNNKITISGSLDVTIRDDSVMNFEDCTFEGPVTINCNNRKGSVTFTNCTAKESVTIKNSVAESSIKMFGGTLQYEPMVTGTGKVSMEGTDIIYKNVTASDSGAGHDNTYDNDAHTCDYEWVTVREAGPGVDGEECYRCKECGRVEAVQTIPATAYLTRELYDQIGVVGENGTVTYEFEDFHTISDRLLTTLQERKDVTLVITFTYQNRQYQTTFPAGSDYTELFEDEEMFYGLLGISGRCGIVTVEVPTGEAPAAAPAA